MTAFIINGGFCHIKGSKRNAKKHDIIFDYFFARLSDWTGYYTHEERFNNAIGSSCS